MKQKFTLKQHLNQNRSSQNLFCAGGAIYLGITNKSRETFAISLEVHAIYCRRGRSHKELSNFDSARLKINMKTSLTRPLA